VITRIAKGLNLSYLSVLAKPNINSKMMMENNKPKRITALCKPKLAINNCQIKTILITTDQKMSNQIAETLLLLPLSRKDLQPEYNRTYKVKNNMKQITNI
jgi:hypothetical protein